MLDDYDVWQVDFGEGILDQHWFDLGWNLNADGAIVFDVSEVVERKDVLRVALVIRRVDLSLNPETGKIKRNYKLWWRKIFSIRFNLES